MVNGNCEPAPGSRGPGEACDKLPVSGPNMELAEVGGRAVVGDGRTSLNREGSFLSLFQMAVPQGKEPGARPIMAPEAEPQRPPVLSADGVPGCEVVGDIELLANEPFLGRGICCEVSCSHDARRTGLWGGATAV